jgi:hypothetical protein
MTEPNAQTLAPLRAFQGWLTAVSALIEELHHTIDGQIEYHESEIRRLRAQRDRSTGVLESMDVALKVVETKLPDAKSKNAPEKREGRSSSRAARSTSRQRARSSGSRAHEDEIVEVEVEGDAEDA